MIARRIHHFCDYIANMKELITPARDDMSRKRKEYTNLQKWDCHRRYRASEYLETGESGCGCGL